MIECQVYLHWSAFLSVIPEEVIKSCSINIQKSFFTYCDATLLKWWTIFSALLDDTKWNGIQCMRLRGYILLKGKIFFVLRSIAFVTLLSDLPYWHTFQFYFWENKRCYSKWSKGWIYLTTDWSLGGAIRCFVINDSDGPATRVNSLIVLRALGLANVCPLYSIGMCVCDFLRAGWTGCRTVGHYKSFSLNPSPCELWLNHDCIATIVVLAMLVPSHSYPWWRNQTQWLAGLAAKQSYYCNTD